MARTAFLASVEVCFPFGWHELALYLASCRENTLSLFHKHLKLKVSPGTGDPERLCSRGHFPEASPQEQLLLSASV